MTDHHHNFWTRRIAIGAVCLSLVTFVFGALVTTKNAGMAFADWPTSDGYLMVTYPWLADFARDWDKFLEHGHRLAGMTIGLWSILLVVVAWRSEPRRWVRWLSASVLLGVICQGLLGGFRVQLDERGLAMLHGIFAAIVFSIMGTLVVVTGRCWREAPSQPAAKDLSFAKMFGIATLVLLAVQYVLGSLIRHQGLALHEHRALGIVAACLALANVFIAWKTQVRWIRSAGLTVLLVTLVQFGLGFAAWFAKYGFPSIGYVATADSIGQVILRTSHMVWGTVTFMTMFTYVVKLLRVSAVSPRTVATPVVLRPVAAAASQKGVAT